MSDEARHLERKIVVFAEEEIADVVDYGGTLAEARAFCVGISHGASYYGSGGCYAYAMPEDLEDLIQCEVTEYYDWDQADRYFDKKVARREAVKKLLARLGIERPL